MKKGAKRFYTAAKAQSHGDGFAIMLDGRPVKTPAGKVLLAPSETFAAAVAAEWEGQGPEIDPSSLALTKVLNTAIDRTQGNMSAVVDELARYAGTDLICYRASSPVELVERQSVAWDPWLGWAERRYGARLSVTSGVLHVAQPEVAQAAFHRALSGFDPLRLTALHPAITIMGSAVLGLALAERELDADAAFRLAFIDDLYQAELWGEDAEAAEVRAFRLADLRLSHRVFELLQT